MEKFTIVDECTVREGDRMPWMRWGKPGRGRNVCRVCGKRRYADRMELISTSFGPMMVCKTGNCVDKMADLVSQLDTVDMKLFYRIFRRK